MDARDHLDTCFHRLHLPCYATLRATVVTNLRSPACRVTVTVAEANRRALRQHGDEVMVGGLTVAWRTMNAERGGETSTRTTRAGREERVVRSFFLLLVGESAYLCARFPRRCRVLGFVRDTMSRAVSNGISQATCPNMALHCGATRGRYTPPSQSIGRSVDTAEERALRDRVIAD